MEALTPREIVQELDKYIVGQKEAKRAVAIALRNRFRRQKLPKEMAEEIAPKNILMIGPVYNGQTLKTSKNTFEISPRASTSISMVC